VGAPVKSNPRVRARFENCRGEGKTLSRRDAGDPRERVDRLALFSLGEKHREMDCLVETEDKASRLRRGGKYPEPRPATTKSGGTWMEA